MTFLKSFSTFFKAIVSLNSKVNDLVLRVYYRSIFYRNKHIKNKDFKWLKEIKITILNENEGKFEYNNFRFILSKNDIKTIPLHQKYLYAALINYFDIPKYYVLFWDDLIIFYEIFIKKIYDNIIHISKGDIVLDIGASFGWYTCKISDLVGDKGKIIAIEPDPKNFFYLKKNIENNNLKNVYPLNLGVWSSNKKVYLSTAKYVSFLEDLQEEYVNKYKLDTEVDVNTIDNIVSYLKLDKVNLIKMDIEGAEVEAIKGAKKTLLSTKEINLIIAAYHKNISGIETYKILLPYLEKRNFKVFKEYLPIIFAKKLN